MAQRIGVVLACGAAVAVGCARGPTPPTPEAGSGVGETPVVQPTDKAGPTARPAVAAKNQPAPQAGDIPFPRFFGRDMAFVGGPRFAELPPPITAGDREHREELEARLERNGAMLAFLVPASNIHDALIATWRVFHAGANDAEVLVRTGRDDPESLWLFFCPGSEVGHPSWEVVRVRLDNRTVTVECRRRQGPDDPRRALTSGLQSAEYCWAELRTREGGDYRIRVVDTDTGVERLTRTVVVEAGE